MKAVELMSKAARPRPATTEAPACIACHRTYSRRVSAEWGRAQWNARRRVPCGSIVLKGCSWIRTNQSTRALVAYLRAH
eukprot:2514661-Prymnesium_polylepis.1